MSRLAGWRCAVGHCVLFLGMGLLPVGTSLADSLLVNATIHGVEGAKKPAEAMVWSGDGRIIAIGRRSELAKAHPDALVIDAEGATVVPGLVDAHGHVLGLGLSLLNADLSGTVSKAQVLERLNAHAAKLPPEAWLVGRGWDQNDWETKAFPTAADLDTAFPDRPVLLYRVDGHAAWANSAAMKRVGKSLDGDWQPDGGRIIRSDGKATGVFVDTAMGLIESHLPPQDAALKRRAYLLAFGALSAAGITGVHDAGVSREDMEVLKELADSGQITLRIYAMAEGNGPALDQLCTEGLYSHRAGRLSMRAVKLYIDGALGSRGAALKADYSDDAGNRGLLVTEPAAFKVAVEKAKRCGVQVATHAIGDRGNQLVLDTYADVLGEDAKGDHRWRIEHAQVVDTADIPKFAALNVIASMQPTHATSDMPWAEARVGKGRLAGAYAWQRFREAKVKLAFGSDFPVEKISPLLGLYAAVTRQDLDGKPGGGWLPDQKLTPAQALEAFTQSAAYAQFAEADQGFFAKGKRADFTVLAKDPLRVPPSEIADIRVVATYLDGQPQFGALSMRTPEGTLGPRGKPRK
ncbi:amidohydrolase [Tahibacter amnicola]|uniref:Amidohydrolase n=1 Tax=Tahibacter amnicola TaxID=2976241 RepID=A0ABY6BCL5_9GAMM|nr:amidohydrolase [Tahibacter amnicola]UXI67282.1 amidohydrolase [Tahibacter amnicola]